ncbi:MAG: type II/IV secretion system protein [Candidatus Delongbacteria bacterium]|nr:type II/IV secretion system protein [Candidatus Delongbacteria bacterium]
MIEQIEISTELQQLVSSSLAWEKRIIPKDCDNTSIEFYTDIEIIDDDVINELEIIYNRHVKFKIINSSSFLKALNKYFRKKNNDKFVLKISNENFIYNLIQEAEEYRCSDIHIEPYENSARIRYRIDGKLIEKYVLDDKEYPILLNKIKIKSNIDIAEKRLPQDGRINYVNNEKKFDIRVSVLPTLYGEKAVLRLLSKDTTNIDINSLGLTQEQLKDYLLGIKKPHGIILISGPTGSGKTTTLYATLKLLNSIESNILTIEDPIEYTLDGINQVQLKESIGLTFSSALRTFLRQDPDIIMLGEIRDGETAQMAIRAALTGHLVLSTIHTNSAWGTISRLIDMGVPSFLLANTMNLSVAQRLVRLLCPNCKKESKTIDREIPDSLRKYKFPQIEFTAIGCPDCFYTGYAGRKAVYEVIPIDTELSKCIKSNDHEISTQLKERNIKSVSESAFNLFYNGITSYDEILPILISNE